MEKVFWKNSVKLYRWVSARVDPSWPRGAPGHVITHAISSRAAAQYSGIFVKASEFGWTIRLTAQTNRSRPTIFAGVQRFWAADEKD